MESQHKSKSKLIHTVITVIITAVVLLFGQGILIKPKISISCGAIDYKIPVKYKLELLSWKMMMIGEDLEKEIIDKMNTFLREYGFSEDKIKLIMDQLGKKKEDKSTYSKIDLKPHEENIIKSVVSRINAEVLPDILMKSLKLPDAAMFFEINNTGFASAKNAHIIIRLKGTAYNVLVTSENKLIDSVKKGSELSFDYNHIAPDSKVKGIVWYSHVKATEALEDNVISISYDGGTVRKEISEDDIFIASN